MAHNIYLEPNYRVTINRDISCTVFALLCHQNEDEIVQGNYVSPMEIDPYFQRCIILVHSLKRAQNNFRIQIIDRALGTRSSILKNGLGTRYFFQDRNEERNAFTKSVERNVFPFLVPRSFLPMHFKEKKTQS